MQEINLLRNQLRDTTAIWQTRNKIFITLLVLLLIVEIGLSVVFFLLNRSYAQQVVLVNDNKDQLNTQIKAKEKDLGPAQAFQAELINLNSLSDKHVYWSKFFDELASKTYSNARFLNIQGNLAGLIHLEGEVKNYTDLGKLILALSTSDKFADVKLNSSRPSKGKTTSLIFALELIVKPELFK